MKNIKKIILSIITFILFINVSYAASSSCPDLVADDDFEEWPSIYLTWAETDRDDHYNSYTQYLLKAQGGRTYVSYCRDAGLNGGREAEKNTTFKCDHSLLDSAKNPSEDQLAYEVGMLEILKKGYSGETVTDDNLYSATTLAIRVFANYFTEANNAVIDNTNNYNFLHKNYANMWAIDFNNENSLLNKAIGKEFTNLATGNGDSSLILDSIVWRTGSGDSPALPDSQVSSILNSAKNLVRNGLIKAAEFRDNPTIASFNISGNDQPTKVPIDGLMTSDGNQLHKEVYNYSLKAENFTHSSDISDPYINLYLNCPQCSQYGIDFEVFINDVSYGSSFSSNNLLTDSRFTDSFENGTGSINLRIELTPNDSSSSRYNCETVKFTFNYKYFDATISTIVNDYYSTSTSCSSGGCQHFYVLYSEDQAISDSKNVAFYLCDKPLCENLKDKCDNGDPEACRQLEANPECNPDCDQLYEDCKNGDDDACEEYESNPECTPPKTPELPECESYVSQAICTKDDTEFKIDEGYETNYSSCGSPTKQNIKKCVIARSDVNNNTYLDSNLINNNKYCSVSCKEDYTFKLPGNQYVNSQRYIELKAGISGGKTCYTSEIDKKTFESDYEETRKELVKAYNTYKFLDMALNHHGTNNGSVNVDGVKCGNKTAGKYDNYSYTFSFDAYDPNISGDLTEWGGSLSSVILAKDPKTGLPKTYIDSATTSCSYDYESKKMKCTYTSSGSQGECTENGKAVKTNASSGTPISGTGGTYSSTTLSSISTYISTLTNQLNNYLSSFNKCATWEMDYTFNPKIMFDYEEEYNRIDRLEAVGEPEFEPMTVKRCTAETNDAYESCDSSDGWKNGSAMTNNTLKKVTKVICTTSGCTEQGVDINQTIYMKEDIRVNANYIVPNGYTNNFPSGGVGYTTSQAPNIENAELQEHSLPVGARPQSKYNFVIYAEDLGEYYDRDGLGRIWGGESSVYKTNMENSTSCRNPSSALKPSQEMDSGKNYDDGVYTCSYFTNFDNPHGTCSEDPDTGKKYCEEGRECTDEEYQNLCGGTCEDKGDGTYTCPDGHECPYTEYVKWCDPCPNCPVVCPSNEACYYDGPNCPPGACPVVCRDCIYTGGLNVNTRPVTPDNLNPNDRNLGSNWDSGLDFNDKDQTVSDQEVYIYTAVQLKAYATSKEIVQQGENIYDIDFDSTDPNDLPFAVEIDLDGQAISWIKKYNTEHSYSENDLKCYDYNVGDKTYENVFCYSNFIDEFIENNAENIKFSVERPGKDEEGERANNSANTYWTTWDKSNKDDMFAKVTTRYALSNYIENFGYDKENKIDYGVGPSWK